MHMRRMDTVLHLYSLKCTCSYLGFYIFVMFSAFRDEMQYIFWRKSSWSFWLLKMLKMMSFRAMQMRFLLFSKKIYCISS